MTHFENQTFTAANAAMNENLRYAQYKDADDEREKQMYDANGTSYWIAKHKIRLEYREYLVIIGNTYPFYVGHNTNFFTVEEFELVGRSASRNGRVEWIEWELLGENLSGIKDDTGCNKILMPIEHIDIKRGLNLVKVDAKVVASVVGVLMFGGVAVAADECGYGLTISKNSIKCNS